MTEKVVPLAWQALAFGELGVERLYALLQLRSAVFVVEQNCVFLDQDDSDDKAVHLLGGDGAAVHAYARCFPPGIKYPEASIGRIATSAAVRGTGVGHELLRRAMDVVATRWGPQPIRIGAQARLKRFYQGHGFHDLGRPYVEDGIDHLEMLWQPDERRTAT